MSGLDKSMSAVLTHGSACKSAVKSSVGGMSNASMKGNMGKMSMSHSG